MAAKSNSIFKITQLAKDLGLKPKELTEKLEALGIGVKNTSAELEAEEVNFLFASLSDEAAIKDIEGYLGGKTEITLPDNKAEEKAAAEKAAAEKAAAERIAAEKAAAEKAEAERIAAEKAAAEKAEAERIAKEKAEAERIAAEKAAAEKAAKEKAEAERIAAEKAEAERIAAEKAAAEKAAAEKAAAERAAKEKADAEKAAQNKQSQQGAGMDNRSNKPSNKDTNKTQQSRQGSDRGAFQKNDSRPAQANRPSGERRFDQKDSRGGFDSRNGDKNDRNNDRNPVPRAPKPVVEQGVEKKRTGGVRVVDTRSSNVDLSKYDERLENIAPEIDDAHTTKQKVKKQNTRDTQQRQGGKKNNKENLAMERMKKANLEKAKKQPLKVTIPDEITVGELAQRLKITAADCIKRLMLMGVMATVNQVIDYDTAYLIADEMGAVVTREVKVTIEDKLFSEEPENEEDLEIRAPVVCVMGHVDHGKTSILDAIRHTNVTSGEAGGITQHIGAYRVTVNGRDITFLDTPGHEAFTAMRARGAQCTDIAILVVAGDDGIMPQTVEAINHAKAAGVDIIVAINKMDKPHANAETVKAELAKYELIPEEWGGDVMCVPVSALTKMGINDLLEDILLIADVKEYKANPHKRAKGVVIEAKLDKGRGPVATVLVQDGTLGAPVRLIWQATAWYRTQAYYDSGSWRATWDGEGGGVLMNQAPHQLDLMQWIFGMPCAVRAVCTEGRFHRIEVEDDAMLFCRYTNGAEALFIASTGENPGTNRLEITGTAGKLVAVPGRLEWWRTDGEEEPVHTVEVFSAPEPGHVGILNDFSRAIREGGPLLAEGAEGIRELSLCNAAYLSAWTGEEVPLPFDEAEFDRLLDEKRAHSRKKAAESGGGDGEYKRKWSVNP